ncbi:MAG: T9SS type A sorting domain-containing protein, partial [Candidatus Cloacimonetes bacterium]|nr:T9SS type A sorting domain-containing protein [Candidatus Cloacimonadota bacterium]
NPKNIGTTLISFNLATNHTNLHEQARIEIYNIKGELIKQFSIENRQSSIKWDGKDENDNSLSSGIYFYQLQIDNKIIDTKRCLLIK